MTMRTLVKNKFRALMALLVALAGLFSTGLPAMAAPVAIELCAVSGSVTLPGAVTVPIWGFGIPTTSGDCSTATASLPGPQLEVNVGDTVTITVANDLPAGGPLSFEIPGITFNPGPVSAASGASVNISFTASAPGTYLYQSGGESGRQAAMGLSGALIVRPATAGQAYDATTAYDVEAVLVLSAIDPAFNAAPTTYNMHLYHATYWLINGQSYPSIPSISAAAGQRVLLRYLNAGYDNTTMALLGMHEQVLARDSRLLNNPLLANAETIPAGATEDAIATVPASAPPSPNGFALFNRQLHVTNGSPSSAGAPGGMLTFIVPSAAALPAAATTTGTSTTLPAATGSTYSIFLPVNSR
jgi:FtsP/CotA-like multicopper oxidase with cupredoxin domain